MALHSLFLIVTICSAFSNGQFTTMLSDEEIFMRNHPILRVSYENSMKTTTIFQENNVQDFQPILVLERKNSTQEIVVGARNMVYRLDPRDLTVLSRFEWSSHAEDVKMCQKKGQKKENCHNFIRLLAFQDEKLLICGTNASSPSCTWRQIDDLNSKSVPISIFNGVGYVPIDPTFNNVFTMTHDGQLVTSVAMDFASHVPAIIRMLPSNQVLKTDTNWDRWLNQPSFIASFEIGNFVYVFFREVAVEVSAYGKFVYSRVARICKNDVGVDHVDKWSTFTKARLNCSMSKTGNGVAFDTLQSVQYVPSLYSIFAAFSTVGSDVPGSAVCVYDVADLKRAFSGPYLYSEGSDSQWKQQHNSQPNFDCQTQGGAGSKPFWTTRPLNDVKHYQLMHEPVQPRGLAPLHVSFMEKFRFIEVSILYTKLYGAIQIIFVLTGNGQLKKFSYRPDLVPNGKSQICLVEVVEILPKNSAVKLTFLKLDVEKQFLLIGSNEMLMKIPVHRCSRHKTQQACIDGKDPYCGWNGLTSKCMLEPATSFISGWYQVLDGCPNPKTAVDGQFGSWSGWLSCPQSSSDKGESCLCKSRQCDSPEPKFGGKSCVGPMVQVTNCTQHGAWASWTDWTPCAVTCGSSVRSRRRSCSNPMPSFGGRVCLGLDTQQEFCAFNPCPVPAPPPVNGGWSHWSHWSQCSKPCNGGYQRRRRFCDNPTPSHNGTYCNGEGVQFQTCNDIGCMETRLWSEWTPWLQSNFSATKIVELKRYRVGCQSQVEDPSQVSMLPWRAEEKKCTAKSLDCEESSFKSVDGGWSEWAQWSMCTKSCGNGTQYRSRTCNEPSPAGNGLPCSDHSKEIRFCNYGSCESTWSCWSDLSDCSTTCGQGSKHRQRTCNQVAGATHCSGNRIESMPCDSGPCSEDGFGEWSGWSTCNKLGVQVRIRPCLSLSYCKGIPDAQMQQCFYGGNFERKDQDHFNNIAASTENRRPINITFIMSILAAFACGIILCVSVSCCRQPNNKSSCWLIGPIKRRSACLSTSPSSLFTSIQSAPAPPPIATPPMLLKSTNIYTPPPTMRNLVAKNGCHDNKPKDDQVKLQKHKQRWRSTSRSDYGVVPNVQVNPLTEVRFSRRTSAYMEHGGKVENDYDGVSSSDDRETCLSATLKKSMRASLKTQDYL